MLDTLIISYWLLLSLLIPMEAVRVFSQESIESCDILLVHMTKSPNS